ncbi:MAG: DNA polymerase III subunit chi [Rhodospirillales bacterium]|nr:DNA polymerase III subunit chi [Rhodospirillales bacterium]
MTDIAFYHLQHSVLEAVLPKLLERTMDAGKRALVKTGSDERAEALAALLWVQDPDSWLPHGCKKDGNAEDQPIWLTGADENPNGAQFLFLTDGAEIEDMSPFERCFDLFDGNDDAALETARKRWKALTGSGHTLTYWQQNQAGKWEKKTR